MVLDSTPVASRLLGVYFKMKQLKYENETLGKFVLFLAVI
jgi:hypothetical protein